jgi:hypothetical protein
MYTNWARKRVYNRNNKTEKEKNMNGKIMIVDQSTSA